MKPADLEGLVTHHTDEVGGLRLHWVEAGAGPTVLLLHGFPESWWSWRHQLGPMAEAGFRVVAADQRGYGGSGRQGPFDLDTLAGDMAGLLQRVGGPRPAHVVGHDWGGAVAWHLAATRPRLVDRLAIVNCPHPEAMKRAARSPRQLARSWYMAAFQVPGLAERVLTAAGGRNLLRVLKAYAVDRANFSDEELEPFREGIVQPGAAAAMLGWYRAIPRMLRDWRPAPRIEAEALLLWGTRDRALGFDDLVPGTERYAPRLRVVKLDEAGHFAHAERPLQVNAALIAHLSH